MAYEEYQIINLALSRVGIERITSADWTTPATEQALNASAVWQYVRDEVMSAKDWRFAKIRVLLGQGVELDDDINYGFDYGYQLPSDFLRLAKGTKTKTKWDEPVYPAGYEYKVETVSTLSGDLLCLLIDYNNVNEDMYIVYIKRQLTVTLWSPQFINALAFRLAAELAIPRTEGRAKYLDLMESYKQALAQADGLNSSLDYQENETGDNSWEYAR